MDNKDMRLTALDQAMRWASYQGPTPEADTIVSTAGTFLAFLKGDNANG